MSELLESLLETTGPANETQSNEPIAASTITEETPPPSLKRNLTPMSNLLESLLKVTLAMLLNVLLKEDKVQ